MLEMLGPLMVLRPRVELFQENQCVLQAVEPEGSPKHRQEKQNYRIWYLVSLLPHLSLLCLPVPLFWAGDVYAVLYWKNETFTEAHN